MASIGERFAYINELMLQLGQVNTFKPAEPKPRTVGKDVTPSQVLEWWLSPAHCQRRPDIGRIADWHQYVATNFVYRLTWGIGSLISLEMDAAYAGEDRIPRLEDWPDTGLPWVVFWLKELITWGTLEPVASYLLAKGHSFTRNDAEERAINYYIERDAGDEHHDELLNAASIRDWVEAGQQQAETANHTEMPVWTGVKLLRDFSDRALLLRVLPTETEDGKLHWYDPGGYLLAETDRHANWSEDWFDRLDFSLDSNLCTITATPYV